MAYDYKDFLVTKKGGILEVVLNRPEARNALSREMDRNWDEILDEAEADPEVRVVTLRGAGKVFSAGHDLKEVVPPTRRPAVPSIPRAWYFPKPIVAGVQGFVGGAASTILFSCDFVIAAEGTKFSFEVYRTGNSSPTFLSIMLPIRVAKKLFMMGGWMDAEQALQFQYVQRVVPEDQVERETMRWAEHLARISPEAVQGSKQGIHRAYEIMTGLPNIVGIKDRGRAPARPAEPAPQGEGFGGSVRAEGIQAALRQRDSGFDPDVTKV